MSAACAGPALSVVVPAHEACDTLGRCLDALEVAARADDEIIVVDDASTDGGVPAARDGLLVIRLDENVGRGPARNLGARRATHDVLVFVDADVVLEPTALDGVRKAFQDQPGRSSLIGAYDDRPGAPDLVSQYRNLLHHRTHHTHGPTAMHFWTGIGAVRRSVFEAVGGFDETNWARDMEDVELGHRLVDAGHSIDVLPAIRGTHLKRFTLRSMVRSDLVHRAIPWSTLLLRTGFRRDAFVLSRRQMLSVLAASASVLGTVVALVGPVAWFVPVACLGAFVLVNLPLWAFFATRRSVAFAVACVPLHLVHSLSSGLGAVVAVVGHGLRPRRPRPP